jgi:hypothetical protein
MTKMSFESILGIICSNGCTKIIVKVDGVTTTQPSNNFFITNAVMAHAIENSELMVRDGFGRIVKANNGGINDDKSKAFALKAFEQYIKFTTPDSPYEISDEHPFFEDTPLNLFGWTADVLPDFSTIDPHYAPPKKPIKSILDETTTSLNANSCDLKGINYGFDGKDDWKIKARKIADRFFDNDTNMNCRRTLMDYSTAVMDEMQRLEVHGPRGRIDNAKTIQRDALQGGLWWKNKKK